MIIPLTSKVAAYIEIDLTVRVSGLQFVDHIGERMREIDIPSNNVDAWPKLSPIEIAEIVEETVHAATAPDQPSGRRRYVLSRIERR